jgi:hypothetical protein
MSLDRCKPKNYRKAPIQPPPESDCHEDAHTPYPYQE